MKYFAILFLTGCLACSANSFAIQTEGVEVSGGGDFEGARGADNTSFEKPGGDVSDVFLDVFSGNFDRLTNRTTHGEFHPNEEEGYRTGWEDPDKPTAEGRVDGLEHRKVLPDGSMGPDSPLKEGTSEEIDSVDDILDPKGDLPEGADYLDDVVKDGDFGDSEEIL